MVEDKCKVCGGDLNLSDSFCPKCGFEHHILPEPVSNKVRMYEEKRINACKKVWEEHKQRVEKLQKDYDEKISENKAFEYNLNEAKAKIATAEQEKGRLKSQVDKANKDLASAKKENQGLVDKVQSLTLQNQKLEEKTKQLKHVEGIIIVNETDSNYQTVATILPGLNTYGSAQTEGQHHMIRLSVLCERPLAPKHFSIEKNGKHLHLKDLTGGELDIPTSGLYVEGRDIYIRENIKVKFLNIY